MGELRQKLGYEDETAAGELLGVIVPTLRNWRSRGMGPGYVRVGRTVLYPIAELRAYLEGNTVRPNDAPSLIDGTRRRRRAV